MTLPKTPSSGMLTTDSSKFTTPMGVHVTIVFHLIATVASSWPLCFPTRVTPLSYFRPSNLEKTPGT